MFGGSFLMDSLLKGGIPTILKMLPEKVHNIVAKTGITDPDTLARITKKEFTEADINKLSVNTLTLVEPYIIQALDHLSTQLGDSVSICISKDENNKLVVDIARKSCVESIGGFMFVDTVTNVLNIVKEAKEGAFDNETEISNINKNPSDESNSQQLI